MRMFVCALLLGAIAFVSAAWGQQGGREPHIGYLYPAGGQAGTTFEVIAGGQNLRGAKGDILVSGEGIQATAVEYYRPVRNLNGDQRKEIARRMKEAREKRRAEQAGEPRAAVPADSPDNKPVKQEEPPQAEEAVKLPGHPLLDRIDDMSLRELDHLQYTLLNTGRRQLNPQIAEMARIQVTIAPNAAPGPREIRLQAAGGVSNPMVFEVNAVPEVQELEPNDPQASTNLPKPDPLELPVLLNGQIMPGDVDRFAFRAQKGQQLVIQAHARSLVPYLADAVPGWFQAALALYDAKGKELAFVDDFRFDPDPVLLCTIPKDGVYELEVRDSIFRGREDFVYRVSIGEHPFITGMFPLGGRVGDEVVAAVDGWNLPEDRLALNTDHGAEGVRRTALERPDSVSNTVCYAVDKLAECVEQEPNDTVDAAQALELPRLVNGRIDKPGDVDVFKIEGRAGDAVVVEVYARRLRSPLDSLVRILDASGAVLGWNDDFVDKGENYLYRLGGVLTHDADSYLRVEFPADGVYYVQLADAQRQGGSVYAYRVRLSPPQPDFALRMTPASLNITAGLAAPVCVHALRQDGFDGEIDVVLKENPSGFVLNGGKIPPGKNSVRMTLSAPAKAPGRPVVLQLEGRATIDQRVVAHGVIPADDMMQAFLYRHLAPAEEFVAAIIGNKQSGPPVELVDSGVVQIPKGGDAEVRVKTPKGPLLKTVKLELSNPPKGVALDNRQIVPEGLSFMLHANAEAVDAGFADNLIVEAFTERQVGKGPTQQTQRVSIGVLPAIPFEVVTR